MPSHPRSHLHCKLGTITLEHSCSLINALGMQSVIPSALLLALLCIGQLAAGSARPAPSNASRTVVSTGAGPAKRIPVIIDQDGGVEDLVAVMLLMLHPRVDLLLVSYLEGGKWAPRRGGRQMLLM